MRQAIKIFNLTAALLIAAMGGAFASDNASVTITDNFAIDAVNPSIPVLNAPENLLSTKAATLAFNWGASADAASGVANYQLQLSTDASFGIVNFSSSPVAPAAVISGLLEETSYYWRVRAVDNVSNNSDWSDTRQLYNAPTVPAVPALISPADTTISSSTALGFDWADSTDEGGGTPSYEIRVSTDPAFSVLTASAATGVSSAALSGFQGGNAYYWQARAKDISANYSDWSGARMFSIEGNAPAVPGLVSPADGVTIRKPQVVFDWEDVTDSAIEPASGLSNYQLELSLDSGFGTISYSSAPVVSSAVIYGLAEGTYYWHVRARDNAGNYSAYTTARPLNIVLSAASAITITDNFAIDAAAPSVPALSAPENLLSTKAATLAFSWEASVDAASGVADYQLQLSTDIGFGIVNFSSSPVAPAAVIFGLLEGSSYYWRVRAVDNVLNNSDWSDIRQIYNAPTVPSVPALVSPADTTISSSTALGFDLGDSSDEGGGAPIYEIRVFTDPAFSVLTASAATVVSSAALSGFQGGNTYYWQARARDISSNYSGWSGAWSFSIEGNAPATPGLVAPADGITIRKPQVVFDWEDIADSAIVPASGFSNYQLELSLDSGFGTIAYSSAPVVSSAVISGVAEGAYYWHVRARDNAGNYSAYTTARPLNIVLSAASAITITDNFAIDATAPSVPVLSAPENFLSSKTATLAFSWAASADAASGLANYQMQLSTDTDFGLINFSSSPVAPAAVVSGLLEATTYYWRVRALDNVSNASIWSATWSFITNDPPPPVPVSPAALATATKPQVAFDWSDVLAGTLSNYELQLSQDINFGTIAFSSAPVASSALVTGLAEGTYYWRVRAKDHIGDYSVYSEARQLNVVLHAEGTITVDYTFTKDILPPTKPELTAPENLLSTKTVTLTLSWTPSSDDISGVANYELRLSTDAGFGLVNFSSSPVAPEAIISGLLEATTYYWHVRAVDNVSKYSDWSDSRQFYNAPTIPSVPALVAPADAVVISSTALGFDWADSIDEGGGAPAYEIRGSTDPAFSVLTASAATVISSAALSGFQGGFTYYWQARSVDISANYSAWSGARTFSIEGNPPAVPGLVTPAAGATTKKPQAVFDWSDVADNAAVPASGLAYYEFELAAGSGFGTLTASSATVLSSAVIQGLAEGDYYWRVRAKDNAGNYSAYSETRQLNVVLHAEESITVDYTFTKDTAAPAASGFHALNSTGGVTGEGQFNDLLNNVTAQLTVQDLVSGLSFEGYSAQVSTDAGQTWAAVVSTIPGSTPYVALSGISGTAEAQALSVYNLALVQSTNTQSCGGVAPCGATNQVKFTVSDMVGKTADAGPFAILAGAPTPTGLAGAVLGVSSVSWTWDAMPTALSYNVYAASNTTLLASGLASPAYTEEGLAPNTPAGRRVTVINASGEGPLSASATMYTLAAAPTGSAPAVVSTAVISLAWSDGGNPAGTLYQAQLSSGDFSGARSSDTLATSASFTGLTPNTTYYLRVRAVNINSVNTAFDVTRTTVTLAAVPVSPYVAARSSTTLSFQWSDGGNPAGTVYTAQLSLAGGFSPVAASSITLGTQAGWFGLAAETTYYIRVKAVNHAGADTDFSTMVTTQTKLAPPAAPAGLNGSALGISSVAWAWDAMPAALSYNVYTASNSALLASGLSSPAYTEESLAANTAVGLRVSVVNESGEGPLSASATVYTLAAAPTGASATALSTGSIHVQWNANGATAYSIERSLVSGAGYAVAGSSTIIEVAVQFTDTGLLAATTYYYRVRAYNGSGIATAYGAEIHARTDLPPPPDTPVLTGQAVSSGSIRWMWTTSGGAADSFTLFTGTGSLVASLSGAQTYYIESGLALATTYYRYLTAANAGGQALSGTTTVATPDFNLTGTTGNTLTGGDGKTALEIPNGLLGAATSWLLSDAPLERALTSNARTLILAASAPGEMREVPGSLTELLVVVNGERYTGTLPDYVTVMVPYTDNAVPGFVDGVTPPLRVENLRLYVLDESSAHSGWLPVIGSQVDTINKVVLGHIYHLSIFTAFGASAAVDLSTLKIYPVPYKPGNSSADDGKPYSAGDINSGIIFDNLPKAVSISIYTISGRLAAEVPNDGSGRLQWDTRNKDGRNAASGGYLAVISAPGNKTVVKKLVIIR